MYTLRCVLFLLLTIGPQLVVSQSSVYDELMSAVDDLDSLVLDDETPSTTLLVVMTTTTVSVQPNMTSSTNITTIVPTVVPNITTIVPTVVPNITTIVPTAVSNITTIVPTAVPNITTIVPTIVPTMVPTVVPTAVPTVVGTSTVVPTATSPPFIIPSSSLSLLSSVPSHIFSSEEFHIVTATSLSTSQSSPVLSSSTTASSSTTTASSSTTTASSSTTTASSSSISASSSSTTASSTPTTGVTLNSTAITALAGGAAGLLVIVIVSASPLIIVAALRRRKKKHKKKPKDYWASVDANRHLGSAANVTMGYIAPLPRPTQTSRISLVSRGHYQLESLSKPLSVLELGDSLQFVGKLHDQYMSIPANMTSMNEIPSGAQEKNRYCDVLPNPNSRVVLFLKFGVANSDYINANYIRGYRGLAKAYIATQGPLTFTVADFWRMIWEQRTTVIIMTTGLTERNMVKCNQYWPDAQGYGITEVYGEIQVTIRKRDVKSTYIVTTFTVQHLERGVTREIIHYWYVKWPDMGVPDDPHSVVDFLLETRRSRESFTMPGPTVVHCSAGIGRTGVFIGADIGMRELEDTQTVDVLKIVSSMRQDRGGMVQTKDQYHFLHKVLYEYAKRMGFVVPRMRGLVESDDEELNSDYHEMYSSRSPEALLQGTTVTFF